MLKSRSKTQTVGSEKTPRCIPYGMAMPSQQTYIKAKVTYVINLTIKMSFILLKKVFVAL